MYNSVINVHSGVNPRIALGGKKPAPLQQLMLGLGLGLKAKIFGFGLEAQVLGLSLGLAARGLVLGLAKMPPEQVATLSERSLPISRRFSFLQFCSFSLVFPALLRF